MARAAHALISSDNPNDAMNDVTEMLGKAVEADRAYIFEQVSDPASGKNLLVQRFEWCAPGIAPQLDDPELQHLDPGDFCPTLFDGLSMGMPVSGIVSDFPEDQRPFFEKHSIRSLLLVPILVEGQLWGFVGFDDCTTDRSWDDMEIPPLSTTAVNIGNAIMRRRTQEELQDARKAAERASEAKSSFMATMSHELRTPLNGVIGMSELLLRSDLEPQQRHYARIAVMSAKSLLELINDILDFSKIEAGKLELEKTEFDLHQAISNVVEVFGQRASQKSLELACLVHPNVPAYVCGDSLRLRQVLANLVNNALKFTERGEVVIEAALQEEDATRATVKISVRDTGIGVPANRLNRLFQSFSQVDASTTRRYGGTGLGLAISKRLTELMGGQIGVDSKEGQGSTFWFTVVLGVCSKPPAAATSLLSALSGDGSATGAAEPTAAEIQTGTPDNAPILLAEDNEINQIVATEMLTHAGFTCDVAGDGRKAIEAVRSRKYDLVLMDCQMPEMDGFQAAGAIRAAEKQGQVLSRTGGPLIIVALTANALKGDRERCIDAGMDDYLSKPIEPDRLRAVLSQCMLRIGQGSPAHGTTGTAADGVVQETPAVPASETAPQAAPAPQAVPAPQAATAAAAQDAPAVDFESLLRRCMGNREFMAKVVRKFLESAQEDADALRKAVEASNMEQTAFSAHRIKGAAANLSAVQLSECARLIEMAAKAGDGQSLPALFQGFVTELARTTAALSAGVQQAPA